MGNPGLLNAVPMRRISESTRATFSSVRYPRGHFQLRAFRLFARMAFKASLPAFAMLTLVQGAFADEVKTLIPPFRLGNEAFFEVYGQIDKGLLVYNDGGGALPYPLVDNSNSSTRLGLMIGAPVEHDLKFGGNFEYEWTPYATGTVNRMNRSDPEFGFNKTGLLRKAEFWLEASDFGKLSVGQGSMASDSTAEVDLSGTDLVSYSAVGDLAGGQFFRSGATVSTVRVNDAFGNLDGLSRLTRVRYDTPSFAGLTASTSIGTKTVPDRVRSTNWDIALRYAQQIGDFKVESAVAYSRAGSDDQDQVDGSASVRHASGLNITLAGGYRSDSSNPASTDYLYSKLGYATSFLDVGETAFSVDFYRGHDFSARGSDSRSFGAAAVQRLDYYRAEIYLAFRLYDYSQTSDSFDHGWGLLTGTRIKF